MKWYIYIALTTACELLSFSSVRSYSSNSEDLLRILYQEKSALREFSFDPFPLFVMLCCLMKIILAIIYITSNIPKMELVISRFNSKQSYFGYVIGKQTINVLICSAAKTLIPAVSAVLLCGFSDIARLTALYFLKQFVLLYLASGVSLILRKKLNSGAADIMGAMLAIVLVMTDIFANIPAALIDLSGENFAAAGCEAAVCLGFTFGCCALYKHEKDII